MHPRGSNPASEMEMTCRGCISLSVTTAASLLLKGFCPSCAPQPSRWHRSCSPHHLPAREGGLGKHSAPWPGGHGGLRAPPVPWEPPVHSPARARRKGGWKRHVLGSVTQSAEEAALSLSAPVATQQSEMKQRKFN